VPTVVVPARARTSPQAVTSTENSDGSGSPSDSTVTAENAMLTPALPALQSACVAPPVGVNATSTERPRARGKQSAVTMPSATVVAPNRSRTCSSISVSTTEGKTPRPGTVSVQLLHAEPSSASHS
jgi:hypothetical protein